MMRAPPQVSSVQVKQSTTTTTITIAWREGRFWDMATSEGTCAPLPGHSRDQLFNYLYDKALKRARVEEAFVVFFPLEPDELVPQE